MGKKIRVIDVIKKNRAKGVYIYYLLNNGKLKRYIVDGYVCYDEKEYSKYHPKEGRPIKENK